MKKLDRKDIDIIGALARLGPKMSTEEVSELVDIPARTVRYRIKKLRETGMLRPSRVMALERRMGLGERVFIVNAKQAGYDRLPDIFYAVNTIYHYSPTYGQYNGYLAYSLYSLSTPRIVRRILEECQKHDLISDFFIVDVTDYDVKNADYTKFEPETGWNWDSCKWEEQIGKNIRSKKKFKNPMSAAQTIVDYDYKDVSILRLMFDDGEITQKKLAETLQLSEAQINKRIHRLEKIGIIKGYNSALSGSEEMMYLFCFFELNEPNGPVLPSIYDLPFPATVIMESETRYAMTMGFSSKDMTGFLRGLDLLRPHLSSFFIQTVHNSKQSMDSHPYDLYTATGWHTPGDEYIQDIRDVMLGKKAKAKKRKKTSK
ncbi:MAG: winged helix-turn-helix transcriptional regulator [Candidatus Thorarchaeota archaeon]|jgi:DNA-binding Lrp family transcriptional regulator